MGSDPNLDVIADYKLYNRSGVKVNTFDEIKDQDLLFLVLPEEYFVWPGIQFFSCFSYSFQPCTLAIVSQFQM